MYIIYIRFIRSGISGAFDWIYGYESIRETPIVRWHSGTALRASASISLKFDSKMLPKKKCLTLATAAFRHGRPSAT